MVYCITKDIRRCDPCLSSWKGKEETGTLIPLRYGSNQLLQSMSKHRRPSAHKRTETQETAVINNDRPKQLGAAVAKINMELWETDSDDKNITDSKYDLSNFGIESDNSHLVECRVFT